MAAFFRATRPTSIEGLNPPGITQPGAREAIYRGGELYANYLDGSPLRVANVNVFTGAISNRRSG
jgi:hypothetical protein